MNGDELGGPLGNFFSCLLQGLIRFVCEDPFPIWGVTKTPYILHCLHLPHLPLVSDLVPERHFPVQ